jgi:hypothetical protein
MEAGGGAVESGDPFDGGDGGAIGLNGEQSARLDGFAIDEDGAGAAKAGLAADMGAGEAEDLAEVMD